MLRERGAAERKLLPRRVEHIEVASLPLTPMEAFVLSQLDGATELTEVALVTGLEESAVLRTIARLTALGAIEEGRAESQRPRPKLLDPRREENAGVVVEEHVRPKRRASKRPTKALEEAKKPKAPEVEAVDIDEERRALIDDMHSRLDNLSHYQLLDVDPRAEKKVIKDAYFRVIALFHPDKYFGKKLGSYKKKLERVFERLTQAYEILTRAAKREEYDRYLVTRRATRALDAVLSSIPPPPPSERKLATPVVSEVEPTVPPVRMPSVDPERRRRMADSLRAGRPSAKPSQQTKLPPEQALEGLRRLLAPRREQKQVQQLDRFRQAGERAFEDGQWVSAVNALRIALSMTPDDERVRALLEEAEARAAAELAGSYQARAAYEEKNQNWEEAARSYQRVAAGRPNDPAPLERAAECLLRSSSDARQAVTLARQAVTLAPKVVSHRLTLARAYEAADLVNSALAELERAKELSPKDSAINEWLARLKSARR